ncbi:MAG: hypothetical protein JO151_04255 [Verrucomicrobia bacterium]|nr:hypothetical protein [Verrucomicrobiota bacterium]
MTAATKSFARGQKGLGELTMSHLVPLLEFNHEGRMPWRDQHTAVAFSLGVPVKRILFKI